MANRRFDNPQTLGARRVFLQGSFAPAGTGQPTSKKGVGFTVTRTGVGTFTVALPDPYFDFDEVGSGVNSATLGVSAVVTSQPVVQQGATPLSFTITTAVAGSATDLAADPNTRVSWRIVVKNTSGNF